MYKNINKKTSSTNFQSTKTHRSEMLMWVIFGWGIFRLGHIALHFQMVTTYKMRQPRTGLDKTTRNPHKKTYLLREVVVRYS